MLQKYYVFIGNAYFCDKVKVYRNRKLNKSGSFSVISW